MNINNVPYVKEIIPPSPCIYALVDPVSNKIRYIGKSMFVQFRYYQHLNSSIKESNNLYSWIKKLMKNDLQPRLFILEECSEEKLNENEIKWIKKINDTGWNLLNFGGKRFYNYSPEFLERIAELFGGKLLTKSKESCSKPILFFCGHCHSNFELPSSKLVKGHWCQSCAKDEVNQTNKSFNEINALRVLRINNILSEMLI